ncbi:hypothetical protein [Klebsiella pneumoniae]|uniref:Uncharacterized protein n=1 Tax=Klebsiella pneumoniae TaxID=573 RepID=A0A483J1Z2_KLEPN
MTITLQAVNELIASLEASGELSIREQKFLKLAKAFKQLAAENVALKAAFHPSDIPSEWTDVFGDTAVIEHDAAGDNQGHSISWSWVDNQEEVIKSVLLAVDKGIETPATDLIVAGIKADGVALVKSAFEMHIQSASCYQDEIVGMESAMSIACQVESQLREGDGK